MADDKDKLNQHDETNEYEFHDDEAPLNYEYDETPAKGKKPKKERGPDNGSSKHKKMIIIVVVVLVILFVVFEVMHKRSAEKTSVQQSTKQAQPKNESKSNPKMTEANKLLSTPKPFPQEQAAKNKQQAASLAVLTASSTDENTALKKQVTDLKAKEQAALDKLQSQQSASQTQVMNLKSEIDGLNQQIQTLTSNLSETQGRLSAIQEKAQKEAAYRANAAKRQAATIRKDKKYFVEAVIPGRAWLKAEDGSTVTVSVGDNLPGYGKVLSINPYDGIVTTQEGAIPYGVSGD